MSKNTMDDILFILTNNKLVMKQIISIFIFLAIAAQCFSQIKVPTGTKSEISKLYTTTTFVVLKNEFMSDYNDAIQEAVNKFWKITPVKFIKESEFNNLRNDSDKSFLMTNVVCFEDDKSNTKFDFLTLSLGGKYKTINDMPTLCAIPLCYTGDDEEKYIYKLGAMVKHCQTHIETCRSHPELNKENILDYYIKNASNIESKKLCLLKDEVSPDLRNNSALKTNYMYDAEFATREQIENLIKSDDDYALIAHIISPLSDSKLTFCVKIIIDTKNGMIYYYDTQKLKKNTDGYILPSDLKKISKK